MSINVNDKNLGHATAYAYYKAGGGTMTEAEFTEFMADFGTASQTAVEAAQAALASKNAAQTAATTATNKASEATTAAQTATTKAGEASTSASTATSAKDTAVSASQTATSKATEATTAAATATSAATTATTAKDDAVSAKTAAQTAQTGAETAAASVQSSAAQIQTNADDISELKEELTLVRNSTNVFNGAYNTGYIDVDGNVVADTSEWYTWSYIAVQEGDSVSIGSHDCLPAKITHLCAYDANKTPVPSAGVSTPTLVYTVPSGVAFVRLATNSGYFNRERFRINLSDRLLPYEEYYADKLFPVNFQYENSTNYVIPNSISAYSGHFMRKDGTIGNDSNYSYTQYIPVHEGDVVSCVQDGELAGDIDLYKFRFITAFDDTLTAVSSKGADVTKQYTVPSGVTYIVCSIWLSAYNQGGLAININGIYPYEPYYANVLTVDGLTEVDQKALQNKKFNSDLITQPFTILPSSFVGNMYYKPLGKLEHPYICLVTDDGRIGMNTYTIPMVISKGVPCTFAIMSGSEVMADATNIAIVKDAVDNHGCEISQHGGVNWTQYTERELNEFFDAEDAFFTSKGLQAKSAVVPSHYNSKIISATAGGRYGVVRSGFGGEFEHTIYYGDYLAGARSNIYMLPSFNPVYFQTLERNKQIVDYAIAHNKIMIMYWHENDLTDDHKTMIEAIIDYAKTQNITFITLGDIATGKVI